MSRKTTNVTTTQEKGGFFNVLMKHSNNGGTNSVTRKKGKNKDRKIICKDSISKSDKEAVVKLYDALVTEEEERPINVTMIMEEGFPVFEETIGETNFKRLKKYFGIECKPSKVGIKEQEINSLLEQLRTVENAQYYIEGYKQLLESIAAKLHDAPEEMTMLERAKFVRMYHTIFVGYYFFAQDFRRVYNYQYKCYYLDVDFKAAIRDNSRPYHPEELFCTNKILIEGFNDDSLFYDLVCLELVNLDKKIQKEVLHFAELKVNEDGRLVSVNVAPRYQTFSSIRQLKNKVHSEMGAYPMELFAYKQRIDEFFFDDIYQLYKILRVTPLENFKTHTRKESYIEGSREVLKDRIYYEVAEEFCVSGQAEIDRIIRMVEYLAGIGYKMKTSDGRICDMGLYMSAFNFLHTMKYVDISIKPEREFELAEMLMARDTNGVFELYKDGEIDEKELKSSLGIDAKFEKEYFGVVSIINPEEVAIAFAIDNGYVDSAEQISKELLSNVILPGNEDAFRKFGKMEIDVNILKNRIGFEEGFAEMYFDLSKVDISAIEAKLQELKRGLSKKGEMKRWTLLINLYCYLVEEQVPCGPKNRVPKRNKGLKTVNLKAQIS